MKAAVAIVLVLAAAAGVGSFVMYRRVMAPSRAFSEAPLVVIPPGSGTQGIARRLVDAGVVRDRLTFRAALWLSGSARRLQAGEYLFDRPLSAADVVSKIARGEVDLISITFPEGLTIAEMARVFEVSGLGPAASFLKAANDPAPVKDLDPRAEDLEGYLFPETYALSRRADAAGVVGAMLQQFRRVVTPEMRAAASVRGLSVRQLVTLASLVERETAKGEERALVASVYSNRLRIGMALQCDPTVIYALQRARRYDGNLRRDDLAFDSPYNTYRYPGLPPGPIAAPGRGALDAAANPAASDYLYFVSRNDGTHVFARSLAEHNANVHRFQVQYFREKRLKRVG